MKHLFLQVCCAAAISALAVGAEAQYGSPAVPPAPAASPVQTDADYAAALAKCKGLMGESRADCIRSAKEQYDRANNAIPSGTGAARGGGPAPGPTLRSKRQ